ncbi:MAG: ABC transporter substrate-binding protein [Betaproteobacteria bacterium]
MNRVWRWMAALAVVALPVAAPAADMNKTLRITFQVAETGFDPVKIHDYYSGTVIEAIYDTLLTYDYLARPSKLAPRASALPEITDAGRTWTFHIKKGIVFMPDPAFKGKRRELVADDFAYAIKRFLDPKNRSPYAFFFEGKVLGLDALADDAKKSGKFDYDKKIPGLETPDPHTLRIRLKEPDYAMGQILAFAETSAVAREVIEAYGDESNFHPVGTGPYTLDKYVRSSKIFLKANPDYRKETWDFKAGSDPRDKEIVAAMKGKSIPAIGHVQISIVEETQARMLAFENGETDMEYQLWDVSPRFLTDDNKLRPEFVKRGVRLDRVVDPEITYVYMNTLDKIGDQPNPLGGFSKERIALRRAIGMAYNLDDHIRIIRKNQSIKAETPIPPGVTGYDPTWKNNIKYDPAGANTLLDRVGYKKGADGFRAQPDGKPLTIRYSTTPDERGRLFAELIAKSMGAIAVRTDIHIDKFPELVKAETQCRLMMRTASWIADYPDGDNFMQLLYGPNAMQSNTACYKSADYDKLYAKSRYLPDGAERNKLYREMFKVMERDTPWIMNDSRYRNVLLQPQVIGFRKHPVLHADWLYVDMDSKSK